MAGGRLHLIETTTVPDVWIDGIGKIEQIAADTYRLLLYRTRRPLEGGPDEHELMLSVLASGASMRAALTTVSATVMSGTTIDVLEIAALMH
jgi:hypothetical protein